jgi:hypothetical protein
MYVMPIMPSHYIHHITSHLVPPLACIAEVYGARALDCVFSPTGMGGGAFDPATLFSIDAPVRVTTLATDDMIIKRLTQVMGQLEQVVTQFMTELMTEYRQR